MCYKENQNILILHAIDDDILANRETPSASSEILATGTPQIRMTGKKEKSIRYRIDQAVGNFNIAAFSGDVIPDIVQVG